MGLFRDGITLESLNKWSENTMTSHLDIEFMGLGEDFIEATMPVDHRTQQPMGILHGGASVTLAETLGSVAASCCIDLNKYYCVGLEINANHIRSVKSGKVWGKAKPIHIGKKTQVWEIRIQDDGEKLVCISRITLAVLERK